MGRCLESMSSSKSLPVIRTKAVGSGEREREAQIFKNLQERERFESIFYIIHKNIYIY
jgi:hypothetical protein